MIFKQEAIKSWFSGVGTSVNNEVIQPFQNANSVISKYNLAIQHNSLTQQGWQRLLAQCDDSLKAYLTSIKGSTASMAGYNVSLQGSITGFTKVSNAIKQYNALGAVSLKEQQAFATAVGATNAKLGSYLIGLNGSTAGLRGYGVSLVVSTAKTIGLTVATTALNAAMTMGISVIVAGLISTFTAWINKSEEITEKAQEAADKINSISESLKTNTETVENAKKRYAELAQEVENLGKITQSQGTLSNEEYEEFLYLSNQLAGIFPSLTKNYDENGNAILGLSGDVNTIVGSLDDLIQKEKELANQKIVEEFPDVFKGYAQDVSNAEQKVKSAQTAFDKINQAYNALGKGQSIQMGFNVNGYNVDTNTHMGTYISWLEDLGLTYEKMTVQGGHVVTAVGDIDVAFTTKLEEARENLQYAQQQLEGEKSSIDSYLNTWLQGEFSYVQIDDSGLQAAIQDMLFNFDFSNIPENKRGDWNYVREYLRRNILFEINKVQDDPVISKAISEVFSNTELTPNEKANYLQQIQDYFGEDSSIVISLKPQIEETNTLQKQYDKAIEDTKAKFDGYDPTAFFKENSINTQEEVDKWLEIAQAANSAADAEERYVQGLTPGNEITVLDISSTVDKLNTQLKPTIDSLAEAYQNIFTTDGFTRDNIGLDMFSSIRGELDNLQKSLEESGSSAVVDYSAYEKLVSVLNDADSSAQQIKDAFDEVALSVANVSITGLEDFQVLKESLEQLGYVDADLVAFEALVSNMDALKAAGLDLADTSLTESDFISFIDSLGISAEYATQAVDMLTFAQKLNRENNLDTSDDVAELLNLANNAGYTGEIVQWLTKLMEIYRQLESGMLDPHTIQDYVAEAKELTAKIEENAGKINIAPSVDKTDWKPTSKSASKAGKDAGDAYLEAFEKELSSLKDLRDRGVIDESEYLNRLRQLYTRYFADKKKYLNEYNKYEREYLEGIKSLYDSALSGISKLQDRQIEGYQDAKDSAVESLEAEKEARLEVIETQKEQFEAQIDLIDEQIEAKEDAIKGIQDEIDAMQEANDERKRQLDIQQKAYNLERMMNQRTDLLFKDGQMIYREDTKGVRGAKEELDDAILEDKISKKEKEISLIEDEIELLEETKDAIQEQIDALGEQADSIEKHYSKMISSTEKYYDSLIKNAEKQKSKWEELAEIHDVADAWSAIEQVFGDLGYTVDDVLSGSSAAFDDFKSKYISLINDMNSNSSFTEGLSYATGVAKEDLGSFLDKTNEVSNGLDEISGKGAELDNLANSMSNVSYSASTASTSTSAVSDDIQKMNTNAEGLDTKLNNISAALINVPTNEKFESLAESFTNLGEAIEGVAAALGIAGEDSVNGLVTVLKDLSSFSLMGEDGKGGIISQFQSLKSAVDEVTSAINGGSAISTEGSTATGANGGGAKPSGKTGSGALTGAIEEIGTTTDETIGIGGSSERSESSEGVKGDGVIGKFGAFKDSVDAVTKAIGTDENGEGSEESTLISALQSHYEKAEETLPEVKTRFEELLESITSCVEKLAELAGGISALNDGEFNSGGVGEIVPKLFANGTDPHTSFTGMVGKAFAKGTGMFKGLSKDEPLAITSEYGQPETIIPPDGNAMITTSPTAMSLKKGTVILNEEQTKEMLNNEPQPVHREFANKTFEIGKDYDIVDGKPKFKTYITAQDFDNRVDFMDEVLSRFSFMNNFDKNKEAFSVPLHSINKNMETMAKQIGNISNVNNTNNQSVTVGDVHVHCTGTSPKEVIDTVGFELKRQLGGIALDALQEGSKTR